MTVYFLLYLKAGVPSNEKKVERMGVFTAFQEVVFCEHCLIFPRRVEFLGSNIFRCINRTNNSFQLPILTFLGVSRKSRFCSIKNSKIVW